MPIWPIFSQNWPPVRVIPLSSKQVCQSGHVWRHWFLFTFCGDHIKPCLSQSQHSSQHTTTLGGIYTTYLHLNRLFTYLANNTTDSVDTINEDCGGDHDVRVINRFVFNYPLPPPLALMAAVVCDVIPCLDGYIQSDVYWWRLYGGLCLFSSLAAKVMWIYLFFIPVLLSLLSRIVLWVRNERVDVVVHLQIE